MQNSVIRYLEDTVSEYPDKTAVVDKAGTITFNELRKEALVIANAIVNKGKSNKVPVFVFLPKGSRLVTTFMGVLYAGDFYTPTDVKFPFEKVKGILDVLNPELIVTDEEHKPVLMEYGMTEDKIINIDELDFTSEIVDTFYMKKTIDTDIAYILFTSGSTGVPKGVGITHGSIIDYIDWARECFQINESSIIGNQAPFYFDNSTLDIYLMLSTGASLHIIPEQYYSFPAKLMRYVKENNINTIFWVPSVLVNVANMDILQSVQVDCLHTILFAGEVMPNKHLNYWRHHIPDATYANLYGPTEITVDCTYYKIDREFRDDEPLPIGVACPNTEVLVFDENRKLITEPDVIGELCVRGRSLSVGYWKNPEKTAEAFIQNPLNDTYEEKIYCTGDLVHYNGRGELMYDGRKDFQIKHMGYRIELGEIETAALGIKEIQEVCVLYDMHVKEIVMVYVGEIQEKDLRSMLVNRIPKYMVPTKYYRENFVPYNDNGKIDRRELSAQYLSK